MGMMAELARYTLLLSNSFLTISWKALGITERISWNYGEKS